MMTRCPVGAIFAFASLSIAFTSGVPLTGGSLTTITRTGVGSNKSTMASLETDVPGRCCLECLSLPGCSGFNLERTDVDHVTCDFKEQAPSAEELTPMPGVQYVGDVRPDTQTTDPPTTAAWSYGLDSSTAGVTNARSCADIYDIYGYRTSGVYQINIAANAYDPPNIVNVYCNMSIDGGKWMVILRRKDGSVNFDRTWEEYLDQFGDLEGELWMGLDFMHNVTELMGLSYELRIDLTSFPREENGEFTGPIEQGYAKYSTFSVGSPESFYVLTVSGFSGNWGDAMATHNGMMFTANGSAHDHDEYATNCAEIFIGPWWYNGCSDARLTGEYGMVVDDVVVTYSSWFSEKSTVYYHGILWDTYLGSNEHPQFVDMKIRPINS